MFHSSRDILTAALCMAFPIVAVSCAPKGRLVVPDVTREVALTEPVTVADADGMTEAMDAERGVPVEALVGQVAGKPIYAHEVLGPLESQLEALGRRESIVAFNQQARELIEQRVRSIIQDALLLDEANRSLEPRQRQGLDAFMEYQRQEHLRRYGQGSQALAERRLTEETGKGLKETLDDLRDGVLIRSFLERNLDPLINVTRLDIARYYRDNQATFNPPAKRGVLILYTEDADAASRVTQELKAGTPFAELAAGDVNRYAGKAELFEFEGDSAFGPEVDPAMLALEPGQWAGPLETRGRYYFIHVETLERPEGRTLMESQIDIERALRDRQAFELRNDFARELRARSSVSDEQRMTDDVLRIARAKYAARS